MQYKNLGRSGLRVSQLSYGAWVTFGNQLDVKEAKALLQACRDGAPPNCCVEVSSGSRWLPGCSWPLGGQRCWPVAGGQQQLGGHAVQVRMASDGSDG